MKILVALLLMALTLPVGVPVFVVLVLVIRPVIFAWRYSANLYEWARPEPEDSEVS